MEAIQIQWEEIKALMPEKTSLIYVDYRDSFDENLEVLQQCISEQCQDNLYEKVDEWFIDADSYSIKSIEDKLKSDIEQKFDIEDAQDIIDEFSDEIREAAQERDTSTPMEDLFRNTSKVLMFYDTGYEMEDGSWAWGRNRVKKERKAIKKHLGIPIRSTIWDSRLDIMIMQASYGGNLEIYFRDDVEDYLEIDKAFNTITFTNPTIGIINHGNGSGDQTDFNKLTISLPLNTKNIFIEKTVKYNWSYDIAGMCHDAYDACSVKFNTVETVKDVPISSINKYLERENKLNEVYKKGGCTPGDMRYDRHRNVTYINQYPCGSRCPSCGTFFID